MAQSITISVAEELINAVLQTCEKLNVQYNKSIVQHSINQFQEPFFQSKPSTFIQLRVAKKLQAEKYIHLLNWRSEVLVDNKTHAKEVLKKVQQLKQPHSTVPDKSALIEELCEVFPTRSIAVDFDPLSGLAKIWHFGRHNFTQMLSLTNICPSMKNMSTFCSKHDFTRIFCTGVDLEKQSMNVYFMFSENRSKSEEEVLEILSELKFTAPTEKQILQFINSRCTAFAITFSWNKDVPERVCFYCSHNGPAPFASKLNQFVADPLLSIKKYPNSFVGCSFGPNDFYTKLETDFYNGYYEFLEKMIDFHVASDKDNE